MMIFKKYHRKMLAALFVASTFFSFLAQNLTIYAAGWNRDANGWYYSDGRSYYHSTWAKIGGDWYYFTDSGYMDYSEYRDGCWLNSDGTWNTAYSNGGWHANNTGWWYEDNSWYPSGQWLWIDGSCYYFDDSGYMESSCYRDGCWLTSSGAWDSNYSGARWKSNGDGWWYEDGSWYPSAQWLWIDGSCYYFDEHGYMERNCYRDGCWLTSGGAWDPNHSGARWRFDGRGWRFQDGGWYPQNQGLRINGEYYWFGADGYRDEAVPTENRADENEEYSFVTEGNDESDEADDVIGYSYKIKPLLSPFNDFFFIETDNPDPQSFRFRDKSSKYAGEGSVGSITPVTTLYADVVYEDADTGRVNGGYIAYGNKTDGGELVLEAAINGRSVSVLNISTGESYNEKSYDYEETSITISIEELMDDTDYLIQQYDIPSAGYFDRMSAIQSGLESICLYRGASVRGTLVKSTSHSYYGISNSPHVDQDFYIQSPYFRKESQALLATNLYPYRYDSYRFPLRMAEISSRIQPDATCKWNNDFHYLIDFTYNGITRSYGGAGQGGGQDIEQNMVKYRYRFDGSSNDAAQKINLKNLRTQICYYGSLEVPDDTPLTDKLTWSDVRKTVGAEGAYVRLILFYSMLGTSGYGFTYFYDDGSIGEGNSGWASIGFFENAWYDGRYFNRHETFEKGTKFGDKSYVDGTDTGTASIIVKDAVIPVPTDQEYVYRGKLVTECDEYDSSTGVWKGFTVYSYNRETGNWEAPQLEIRSINEYEAVTDTDFIDACTLTPEEVRAMNVDKNADKIPTTYYIYDTEHVPGTKNN
ncbi:MAG: hypothetical protein IJ567_07370 [Lachnospiraceae bacterium]|nr:hypothetical protein [Lachnospiraceae bacterium]